jgi:hypothetical protein
MGKKWASCDDWSKEDTGKLPKAMLDAVEQFMVKEDVSEEGGGEAREEEEEGPKLAS